MMRKLFTVDYYLPIFPFVNKIFWQNFWIYSIQTLLASAATWWAVWIGGLFLCMKSLCVGYHTQRIFNMLMQSRTKSLFAKLESFFHVMAF